MKTIPQTKAVVSSIKELGHATSRQFHAPVQKDIPDILQFSVHRITRRLIDGDVLNALKHPKVHLW